MYAVAVVDANPHTRGELGQSLAEARFSVSLFTGWRDARPGLAECPPDAIVLADWRRSGGRGGVRYLRRVARGAPFVAISDGSITGHDDRFAAVLRYPVTVEELAQAVREAIAKQRNIVKALGYALDLGARSLAKGEVSANLTRIEAAILRELLEARGEFVTSAGLLERVWGDHAGEDRRILYTHMAWLRRKLTQAFGEQVIESARRLGYRFTGLELEP